MSFEYNLNKAQKEAVEYTNGPLLIVAGAGTGKTTVITNKICYLIEKGLAKPEEILALTFTEKAANEMQERVDALINVGYSEMHVSTFHTFCQKILERHAIDIGLSNQFKLLTETAAWILVRKNFSKFNLDYYRPMGNPMRHIHELLRHFSKCKDELIVPAEYLEYAEGLAKDTGDMNVEEKSRLTEISNAYHVYNQLLLDNAMFDFGDLIFYAVKLFTERPAVLQKFQNQFKYILVDEFQDVNWAQYKLVQLLAGGGTTPPLRGVAQGGAAPQLTVVGDDDQSIYAFRGASVSNILRFKDDYPDAKEIVLNENYRSRQEILDTAYELIQNNNPDRLEVKLKIDKRLESRIKNHESSKDKKIPAVTHLHNSTLDEEVRSVIEEIIRLKEIKKDVVWDDFAVLVRANSHADPFISELERRGIPYEFLASSGLYRQPIILDALNYFKLLNNYHESSALYRLLCLPFLNFKENDLQKITHNAKKKSISYYEALKRGAEFDLSQEGLATGSRLIDVIHEGMKRGRFEKPSVVLYQFLEKIGYLTYLTHEEGEGNREVIRQIYHLKQFFEYLAEYETINPEARVADFLEHFIMIMEAGDKGAMYQPSDTPDSVNILTIHAAKGLEFKYVFIINLVEDRFPSRNRGDGIEIPAALIKEQLPEGDSHIGEERRLFYVAITRAKERLYFTSASDYGGMRTKKISRFLDELGYSAPAVAVETRHASSLHNRGRKPSNDTPGKFVFELPKAFSFSQLRSYETCPYQYKLAHILNIPGRGNASFSFGQTMHSTLQAFYQRTQELNAAQQTSLFTQLMEPAGGRGAVSAPAITGADSVSQGGETPPLQAVDQRTNVRVPPLEELLSLYDKYWIPDWYRSKDQREEYYAKGKEILKIFYTSQEGNWIIPVNLESWFKIKVGNYLVHGRIDRIDQLPDGTLEIIDYKTGKAKETLSADDKEQLLIYQIAVEQLPEYNHVGKPSKLTFYYLNDNLRASFLGNDKELEKLKEKLVGTIDRIHQRDFAATPSQFACENCDFKDICEYRF